ncbi:sodium:calcium antiporter [Pontibacillus yanchengensis]|uniref:Sodium:calcium antiporter n=1 Tax=Pontibacillus yanchengensis Y32 TaxID=1385514 RepID=A0A0A2T9J3_9BACI|nr:sodium:calcium antiporter [Pontibacillus yanchengensis]KGP71083.1 sodium:calcium antiporter [Pontibacillus yanchengensis Y32]
MNNILVFVAFILAAIATYFVASRLAMFGDGVSEKTKTSSAFMGIVIGAAISLPELTASVTAISIDSPDLAIGNLLGSNLFNLLALAVLDIIYRNHQIMGRTDNGSKLYIYLVVFMTLVVIAGLSLSLPAPLFNISFNSIVLVLIYFLGVKWVNSRTEQKVQRRKRKNEKYDDYSYKQVLYRFIICAVLIMIIGSVLTVSADQIAKITGLGSSFVGSFLVGASTSLPDAVSVITALRMRNYSMGVSSLLGSNAFNIMLLSFTDAIYLKNNLFDYASPSNIVTSISSIVVVLIILYTITRKQKRSTMMYVIPPTVIVIIYFVATFTVYQMK